MHSQTLKFNTVVIDRQEGIRHFVLGGLLVLGIVLAMYGYFMGKIVFDAVARGTAQSQIKLAQSSVAKLQSVYFDQLRTIDLSAQTVQGLAESKDVIYASRVSGGSVVGMLQ